MKLRILVFFLFAYSLAFGQGIPSPESHFGFKIGKDYHLANYTQTEAYFKKVAAASDLVKLESIGKTEEGREQYMLIVTSPENHNKLDRYKEISTKMARAEAFGEVEARAMAKEGKAVVWIDGGLHSTETVATHQLIETIWQMVSRKDDETQRILEDVIILFVHANPDGHELIGDWYMKDSVPEKRSLNNLPVLYQKYIGHDNNRDFYIQNMKESRNMGYQLFVEWIPQVMYNHHQRGPAGSVLAGPPYRDPFNYVFDPLMVTGIDAVGAAMYNRLITENKPGFTRMDGSSFSTWYNGGLRTNTHFHNMIGILTEIIGGPNPEEIPLVPDRMIPNSNTPFPVMPQKSWHFQQSIDYSVSLNFALLDYAARNKDHLLYNIYAMGKSSIGKGNMDYWTAFPRKIDAIKKAHQADLTKQAAGNTRREARGGVIPSKYYDSIYLAPMERDPRGFIIPADQTDFATAVKFVNALVRTGIRIEKAMADFTVNGKKYLKGAYVVKTDQAFRPHVIDMFEPQDYPNDFQYPGGPPIRPYDAAGWTLAYQMGVGFDRIMEAFDGPFETLSYGELQGIPVSKFESSKSGYMISAHVNDAFVLVNELIKGKVDVFRTKSAFQGLPEGSFYIPSNGGTALGKLTENLGIPVLAMKNSPKDLVKVKAKRIALFDTYGGSMPSGWVRWMLEQYHFDFDVVYAKDIDAGELHKKYDILLFISGGIPSLNDGEAPSNYARRMPTPEEIPSQYHHLLGEITPEKSIPQIKKFLENGGDVLTVGSSAQLAFHLDLPVKNALMEIGRDGKESNLPGEKYYVPGSVMVAKMETSNPANWGMKPYSDIMFNNSLVFKLKPEAKQIGLEPLAWFDRPDPLKSGWAWGQSYLEDGVLAFKAPVGKGSLFVYSPEITFRAQSHGTFKMLFNNLYNVK
ncbi:M14 metallopeptidase family protein [Rhodonellum sp.]|uniref:M14 family metallopeptidase n=1 Tax=Rhodonellum sp. TaxID=2231180 RepID=UPI002727CEF5|nr:M14 metallopeptidase family protein [Rhodonellum sp.]MDO9552890.1 M14 family metallopeptidase [Rhodonellum sp.]